MTDFTNPHEPTEEFRSHLEREIVRALRRDLGSPPEVAQSRWRFLRAAAVILIALGVGAAGGVLSAQVQDNRQRDSLLAAERSELAVTGKRVELARAQLAEVRRRYDTGAVGRQSLAEAQAELSRMEAMFAKVQLDIAEIEATSRPPRDDLAAPRSGQRDFMGERLQLDLAAAQQRLVSAEEAAAEAERQYRVGMVRQIALLEPQAELARAREELELLVAKLDLRQQFLQGQVEGSDLARRFHRLEMERDLGLANILHELAEARLSHLRQLRTVGAVEQLEVLRVELDVAELAAEIEQIRANMRALDQPG